MRVRAYVPLPLSETSPRTALECGSVYGGGGCGGGGDRLCFVCARARADRKLPAVAAEYRRRFHKKKDGDGGEESDRRRVTVGDG